MKTCKTCRFLGTDDYAVFGAGMAEYPACRRAAPMPVAAGDERLFQWPEVRPHIDWCGEWEPAEEPGEEEG